MARIGMYRSNRTRNVVGFIVVAALAWGAFTWVRSQGLRAQGRQIAQQGQKFKTDYFVGAAKAPLYTYLVLGDSTAAGWGAERLEATYPYKIAQAIAKQGRRVHVVNFAVGGATIRDVCQNQMVAVWTVRPDMVTVSVGANDAVRGTPTSEYKESLQTLLATLQNSEVRTVLLANTPDMYQVPALPLPFAVLTGMRARRYNKISAQSKVKAKIKGIDLYKQGKLIYRQDPTLYAADLFHPSGKGYERWAQIFLKSLAPAPAKK